MHRNRGVLVGVRLLDLGRRRQFAERPWRKPEKLFGEIGDCQLGSFLLATMK